MSGSENYVRNRDLRLSNQACKTKSTTKLDMSPGTYLPPVLCEICAKINLNKFLTENPYESNESGDLPLIWDLETTLRSTTRCRLCRLLVASLLNCDALGSATPDVDGLLARAPGPGRSYNIYAVPKRVAEYQCRKPISLWEAILGIIRLGSEAFREELCDRVSYQHFGWRLDISFYTRESALSHNEALPAQDSPISDPEAPASTSASLVHVTRDSTVPSVPSNLARELPQVEHQKDHPAPRGGVGFRLPASSNRRIRLVSGRSISHLDRAFTSDPPHPKRENRTMKSIQFRGRNYTGPLDRISSSYETENILKCRGIDPDCANFDLVRYWLSHCASFHAPFCEPLVWPASPSTSFTLRVIDVQRQYIMKAPKNCQYLALSYRWPQDPKVQLDSQSYPRLTRPGALAENEQDIPKTISDAMTVCKKIKKRYLWVDALCIIQDSADDKAEQINNMGFVYSGAYLTIAAAFGEDGDAGLPGVSNIPRKRQHCTMKIGSLELITAPSEPMESLFCSTWYSRGWTYQELILSKRVLAFTEDMMLFFCVEGSFREDVILESFNGTVTGVADLGEKLESPLYLTMEKFQGRMFPHDALRSYEGFLRNYIYRTLTNDDDILNAFGGILDALFVHLGPFRWGIPIFYAPWAMTWHSKDEFPLERRQGFPTWSWTAWKNIRTPVKLKSSAFHHDEDFSTHQRNLMFVFTETGNMHGIRMLCAMMPERFNKDFLEVLGNGPCINTPDHQVWDSLKDMYHQYVIFWAKCALLNVDQEPEIEIDEQDGGIRHVFHARNESYEVCSVYLDPTWRKNRPDRLEFVAFARTRYTVELMLIERSGPVAYRVQTSHESVPSFKWQQCSPVKKKVILG